MYCLKKCSQHVASLFFGYIGHTISRRCAAATRPRGLHKFACVAGWMDSGLLGRKLLFAGRCTTKLGAVTMHMRRPRLLGRRARPVCLHPHLRSSYVPRPGVWLSAPSATIAGSPLRQTDIDVRGSVSVVGVRPIHDPVTDTPRAPRRARAATRTLGPLSCADALSLHRRFAISTSCALAAADVRLEQEAHRARY